MKKLAIVLAATVAVVSVADYLGWRSDHRRLLSLAAGSGLTDRQPGLTTELRRETVATRAATDLAWHLLGLEIDRAWLEELPPEERAAETRRGLDRLGLARRLAEGVLARQPASWRAATVLGASRYLEASRQGRQDQPVSAWREPLRVAMRLGPGYPEPPVILASFYLSRWSSLTAAERQEVPNVLARAFEDARGLERLLPAWVRLAPSLDRLLEALPDHPGAWQELSREFLRQGDLERFGASHRRHMASLAPDLAGRLERGIARLRGGHARGAFDLLRSVFAAPPDLAYADSFSAALAALPEEEVTPHARRDLKTWLGWAGDLCAVRRCPLDEETMTRLARFAGMAEPSDPETAPAAAMAWPAGDWQRRGVVHRLALSTVWPAEAMRLEIAGVPPTGAAVELRWDGRFLGVTEVEAGEPLVWQLAVEQGLHLLEIRHLTGRPLQPGKLTLEPAGQPG